MVLSKKGQGEETAAGGDEPFEKENSNQLYTMLVIPEHQTRESRMHSEIVNAKVRGIRIHCVSVSIGPLLRIPVEPSGKVARTLDSICPFLHSRLSSI